MENTSFNNQIVKEVKNTMDNNEEMFSSLFNSINILEVSEEIFEIIKRIHVLSDSIKEIKELCEEEEYNCKKEDFIQRIESDFKDAKDRGFDSIVIAIDNDLGNTYYINDTKEGFQFDLFDYVFDDLNFLADMLYKEMEGNVVDIRIE